MIISVAQAQLFFLALTRTLAILAHIPFLGSQNIPPQVRIGLGVLLAAILIPWQPLPAEAEAIALFGFTLAIGKEVLLGTLAGFAAALTFGAVQVTGEAMGLGSGFSSSRIFNPTMGESGSAFNQIFIIIAMMYFLVIDGHHLFIAALQRSFQVIPLNGEFPFASLETLIRMTAQLITTGVHLGLPVMAALILTDLTLGLLARVSPQVQVYFLGLPVKVGISLLALGLMFAVVFPYLANLYQSIGPRMIQLLEK